MKHRWVRCRKSLFVETRPAASTPPGCECAWPFLGVSPFWWHTGRIFASSNIRVCTQVVFILHKLQHHHESLGKTTSQKVEKPTRAYALDMHMAKQSNNANSKLGNEKWLEGSNPERMLSRKNGLTTFSAFRGLHIMNLMDEIHKLRNLIERAIKVYVSNYINATFVPSAIKWHLTHLSDAVVFCIRIPVCSFDNFRKESLVLFVRLIFRKMWRHLRKDASYVETKLT